MTRKEITTPLDIKNMDNHNSNYEELYNKIAATTQHIVDDLWEVMQKVNSIKLKEPVNNESDLPQDEENNTLRMVLSEGKVYAYNNDEWKPFQEIELDPYKTFKIELKQIVDDYETKINNLTSSVNEVTNATNESIEMLDKKRQEAESKMTGYIQQIEDKQKQVLDELENFRAIDTSNWQKSKITKDNGRVREIKELDLSNPDSSLSDKTQVVYVSDALNNLGQPNGFLYYVVFEPDFKRMTWKSDGSNDVYVREKVSGKWNEWTNLSNDAIEIPEIPQKDITIESNSERPPKPADLGNNYKLIQKLNADELIVYQVGSNSYLRYKFKKGIGGKGYGDNYELMRLHQVKPMADVITYVDASKTKSGTVTPTWDFSGPSSIERSVLENKDYNKEDRDASKGSRGLQVYTLKPGQSVTYSVNLKSNKDMNVAFFARSGYTNAETFEVLVDGAKVFEDTITQAPNHSYRRFPFKVGERNGDNDITIKNTSSKDVYLGGINVYHLNEYNGQDFTDFVAYGMNDTVPFINSAGASDYAFKNLENGLQFGSYHGGEVVDDFKLDYAPVYSTYGTEMLAYWSAIDNGKIWALKNFSMRQISTLIDRANMLSDFSFNSNGTLNMDFSYNVIDGKEPVLFENFWTALTCGHLALKRILVPKLITFDTEASGSHKYFKSTRGYAIQGTLDTKQEMHIRHNRFDDLHVNSPEAQSFSDQPQYCKYYYAPIRQNNDANVAPTALQFGKSLDFYVR
ncbi:hypothetical protein CD133_10135 [Staphylococcus massiliensis CCUG 55927]|uniref:hypothetical protein n=1 Tax=Staphylococcus massiliensis TaxID=555791 RepID=UPI0003134233|nr:hypothetical protein [Staphylococcus massiliensis]PNZ97776.1 hypothetical protein CD133_10135 [Staphylococcus massiliensis CCUG 55927]